jgi:outer membrane biosynthesis protein TonB
VKPGNRNLDIEVPGGSGQASGTFNDAMIVADEARYRAGSDAPEKKPARGKITYQPHRLRFSRVQLGTSRTLSVALSNKSTVAIDITKISVTGRGFTASQNCVGNLPIGSTCQVSVTFSPTSAKKAKGTNVSGTLTVKDDASNNPQTVPLSAVAFGPAGSLTPTPTPSEPPTPTPSPGSSTTPTPGSTNTPSPARTTTPTPAPTNTLTPAPTNTPTPVPTNIPTATPSPVLNITFVGSTTTGAGNATQTAPAAIQSGDLLLAYYSFSAAATATAPADWTFSRSASATTALGEISVWYRIATAADTAGTAYLWSFSTTAYESGAMLAYRGVDPNTPIDRFSTDAGTSTSPTLATLTTANFGDVYVGLFGAGSGGTPALPANLSVRSLTQYIGGVNYGQGGADLLLGAVNSVAAESGTMSYGGWATVALALKALNPPATPTPTPTATPSPTPPPTPTPAPPTPAPPTPTPPTSTPPPTPTPTSTSMLTPTPTSAPSPTPTEMPTPIPSPTHPGPERYPDGNANPDRVTGADAYANPDSDPDTDYCNTDACNTDANFDAQIYSDGDTHAYFNAHGHTDGYSDSEPNWHSNTDADLIANANSDRDADAESDVHTYTHGDPDSDPDPDADPHPNADSHTKFNSNPDLHGAGLRSVRGGGLQQSFADRRCRDRVRQPDQHVYVVLNAAQRFKSAVLRDSPNPRQLRPDPIADRLDADGVSGDARNVARVFWGWGCLWDDVRRR